jgi:guanine deaminase
MSLHLIGAPEKEYPGHRDSDAGAMREDWMRRAIDLALENVRSGRGGPFGAVVVKDGRLVATGVNLVTTNNDPSAHAEIVAIRAACQALGTYQLRGCELYTNCEPCPMCLGAIYWARAAAYYFACTRRHAAEIGFDDGVIYDEIALPPEKRSLPGNCLPADAALQPFVEWAQSARKVPY